MAGRKKAVTGLELRLPVGLTKKEREDIESEVGTQIQGEKLLSASDVVRYYYLKGRRTRISEPVLQKLEEFAKSVGFRELSDAAEVILEQFLKLSEDDQWAILGLSKTDPALDQAESEPARGPVKTERKRRDAAA